MPNNLISLAQAIQMTTRYRNNRETILAPGYKGKDILPICETFDRSAFDTVLSQSGCVKLRAYLGMDENDLVKVIVVGVNENDEDILPAVETTSASAGDDGAIIDEAARCPRICPPPSPLNG